MNKLSLKLKLGIAFGILLAIIIVAAGAGFYTTYLFSDSADQLVFNATKQNLSMEMVAGLQAEMSDLRGFILNGKEEMLSHDRENQADFKKNSDKMEQMLVTEKGKRLFAEIRLQYQEFR